MPYSGALLRKIRNFKDIKQSTAANLLRMSQPAYCKLEQQECIPDDRWQHIMQGLRIETTEWQYVAGFMPPPASYHQH